MFEISALLEVYRIVFGSFSDIIGLTDNCFAYSFLSNCYISSSNSGETIKIQNKQTPNKL